MQKFENLRDQFIESEGFSLTITNWLFDCVNNQIYDGAYIFIT